MAQDPHNPSAFPFVGTYTAAPGMTLRDWFAGQALAGWLADGAEDHRNAAKHAYLFADAMLLERKK